MSRDYIIHSMQLQKDMQLHDKQDSMELSYQFWIAI